jgi:exopolyphosphatase/guanosine-5'-triphosphate,3'-diphosphate pyrophosphatase
MKTAGIDIGTNTILMVVGNNINGQWEIVRDEHSIARLGAGVDSSRSISDEAIERGRKILMNYRSICTNENVEKIKIASTSALRDAGNREKVVAIFSDIMKSPVHVISGEEEARLSFLGTVHDEEESMVIDIGGGSSELITGRALQIEKRCSTPLGTVRITERLLKHSPALASEIDSARRFIADELTKSGFDRYRGKVYAVAGTATTIAAVARGVGGYSKDSIHGYELNTAKLAEITDIFLGLSASEINSKYGINPMRADVITAGALVLSGIFSRLGIEKATVSTEGLRYGIMKHFQEQ